MLTKQKGTCPKKILNSLALIFMLPIFLLAESSTLSQETAGTNAAKELIKDLKENGVTYQNYTEARNLNLFVTYEMRQANPKRYRDRSFIDENVYELKKLFAKLLLTQTEPSLRLSIIKEINSSNSDFIYNYLYYYDTKDEVREEFFNNYDLSNPILKIQICREINTTFRLLKKAMEHIKEYGVKTSIKSNELIKIHDSDINGLTISSASTEQFVSAAIKESSLTLTSSINIYKNTQSLSTISSCLHKDFTENPMLEFENLLEFYKKINIEIAQLDNKSNFKKTKGPISEEELRSLIDSKETSFNRHSHFSKLNEDYYFLQLYLTNKKSCIDSENFSIDNLSLNKWIDDLSTPKPHRSTKYNSITKEALGKKLSVKEKPSSKNKYFIDINGSCISILNACRLPSKTPEEAKLKIAKKINFDLKKHPAWLEWMSLKPLSPKYKTEEINLYNEENFLAPLYFNHMELSLPENTFQLCDTYNPQRH